MLDLSRIEAGGLHLRTEPVGVIKIIAESITAIQPYADSRNVTIRMGDIDTGVTVLADPMRLRQILQPPQQRRKVHRSRRRSRCKRGS